MPFGEIISGGTGLTGAQPRSYNPASGGVPGVTSPIEAIAGNLGGLGNIVGSITGQQSSALRSQYPDQYFSTLGTLLGNTGRRAAGDISDLLPELQQSSAENAVYGGMSGSQAENTKLLRDLGLTRYGVENQALKDLGTIQSEIPTVKPFDPSALINEQLAAQERADMYRSAPVPEDAYRRALEAAGGTGRVTPGLRYDLGGGGVGRPVDAIMGGYGAPTIGYGTNQNVSQGGGYAPWGTFPNAVSAGGEDQDPFAWLWGGDTATGNTSPNDFGGGLDYGGGAPWGGLNTDIFGGTEGTDLSGEWLNTDLNPASGDYYDQGY
jgi:hypothetical protein